MKTGSLNSAVFPSAGRSRNTGFRWELKDATFSEHEKLDEMMSGLDLTSHTDIVRFFNIHLACFSAMSRVSSDRTLIAATDALREDLRVLGHDHSNFPSICIEPYQPLAGEYLLCGSRMGTKVLKKRWMLSGDPKVQAACNYFSLDLPTLSWSEVCARLNEVDASSQLAKLVITDVRNLFSAFTSAFRISS